LRLFSFGGYGLALAALALMVFGAVECPPPKKTIVFKDTFWVSETFILIGKIHIVFGVAS